jgi:uncharacterized repeat protein (TIGR03847 family)
MDLGTVDRITADAVGEPGSRTFYLQARNGKSLVTLIVEKEQVRLLAASVLDLLASIGLETGTGPDEDAMLLEEPFEPLWRAGRLSIGYEQDTDLFLIEVEEFQPEREELEEDDPRLLLQDDPEELRLRASRDQMFALSRHASAVIDRGRPTCQFCGNPLDPEGHACPAMNGHSKRA